MTIAKNKANRWRNVVPETRYSSRSRISSKPTSSESSLIILPSRQKRSAVEDEWKANRKSFDSGQGRRRNLREVRQYQLQRLSYSSYSFSRLIKEFQRMVVVFPHINACCCMHFNEICAESTTTLTMLVRSDNFRLVGLLCLTDAYITEVLFDHQTILLIRWHLSNCFRLNRRYEWTYKILALYELLHLRPTE